MQTRCPACQTLYRIDDDVLQRAGGQARCFRCDTVFDAYANPGDRAAEESDSFAQAPVETHAAQLADLDAPSSDIDELDDLPDIPDADGFDSELDQSSLDEDTSPREPATADVGPVDADLDPASPPVHRQDQDLHDAFDFEIPEDLPDLEPAKTEPLTAEQALTTPSTPGLIQRVLPGLAAVLLILTALGQLTWQQRDQVLATPAGHSLAEGLCSLIGCALPPRRAPSRFVVLERNLSPVPGQPGVLALQLSFRNTADFPQPLPDIQLSLYDSEENLMARRRLHPDEYLFPAPATDTLVESDALLRVDLQMEDPGRKATGFKLEFL